MDLQYLHRYFLTMFDGHCFAVVAAAAAAAAVEHLLLMLLQ